MLAQAGAHHAATRKPLGQSRVPTPKPAGVPARGDCSSAIRRAGEGVTAKPRVRPGGPEALLVTLVICGVLAMVVVAIAAGFIYSRFEGGKANVLAFALGGMGLAAGLVVAFTMASPS